MCQGARAVGSRAIKHTAVVRVDMVFRCTVQQHIHVRADMHVAKLERASEGKDEGYVLLLRGSFTDDFDVGWGSRGETTRERGITVDVKLEQVEEGVADHGNGTVLFVFDAILELEGLACLVASREGDPLDLVRCVLNVFARFPTQQNRRGG